MAGIKVAELAYGRLFSPDLDKQEKFLTDFGMVRAARTPTTLYMRGTDPQHHIHVTELGEPRFGGYGFIVSSEEELEKASRLEGASKIETVDEPGGGKRVRLTDPLGYRIDVIHGMTKVDPLPVVPHAQMNTGSERKRIGGSVRLGKKIPQVKRIGHAGYYTTKSAEVIAWYRQTLGLIQSDDIYRDEKSNIVASFNRCDQGDTFVDHHAILVVQGDKNGLNHLSFEVQDFDDLMLGHHHLRAQGYKHAWGIGRHGLGSNVFDYWADPWGRLHEQWTDADLMNRASGSNLLSVEEGFQSQWGSPAAAEFRGYATP